MEILLEKAAIHFESDLPFVIYNKPDSDKLIGVFQRDKTLHLVNTFDETGFVFAPFSGDEMVLIPENLSEVLIEDFTPTVFPLESRTYYNHDVGAKSDFEKRVSNAVDAIRSGKFEKLVLSRKEIVKVDDFDLMEIFKRLLHQYPNAFTYCFFHPKVGLWLGAFSEQLLKMNGRNFKTMAVAGTQPFHENEVKWGEKEKDEQQFVTDFITSNLRNVAATLEISEPYNLKAGNVVHIKTDIKGTLGSDSGLREMIEILHPTPAVCGLPKQKAQEYLLKNEGYNREYYSGFFGEFNKDFSDDAHTTDLYVNLRCMQIVRNEAFLYIGCGITKDSIPEKEWEETVNKSVTMKRILNLQSEL